MVYSSGAASRFSFLRSVSCPEVFPPAYLPLVDDPDAPVSFLAVRCEEREERAESRCRERSVNVSRFDVFGCFFEPRLLSRLRLLSAMHAPLSLPL